MLIVVNKNARGLYFIIFSVFVYVCVREREREGANVFKVKSALYNVVKAI